MANEEHLKLSNLIKEIHSNLRKDYKKFGGEETWTKHLSKIKDLQNYAVSMQKLSTTHWDSNLKEEKGVNCRIKWVLDECNKYFLENGRDKYMMREQEISRKMNIEPVSAHGSSAAIDLKIRMLDVGSCYNPFAVDDKLDVTAIDIAPFSDKVFQCDFLNVNVGSKTILSEDNRQILQLEQESFDVCVFSLLLEYLPCPQQRYICCKKAYDVLKPSGILVIITPDSKHVGANAKIMKSWRFVLAKMGFMRITYNKLRHLHCLSFRKCFNKEIAIRWTDLQVLPPKDVLFTSTSSIFIPQDFQESSSDDKDLEKVTFEPQDLISNFHELPEIMD